jgi:hypothetical protein
METDDTYSIEHRNAGSVNDTIPLTLITNATGRCVLPLDTFLVVYPEVTADFNLNYSGSESPVMVTTVNNSVNASSFLWDFGDGTTSAEENPSHSYVSEADTTYILRLTAMSDYCSDTETEAIAVPAPLALQDDPLTNAIHAYFRPDLSELIIENKGETVTLQRLLIFGTSGSLILSRECNYPLDRNSGKVITLNELRKGNLYMLTMVIDNRLYNLKIFYP